MNHPEFIAYLAGMRPAISEKTDPDTISPTNVGEDGFADLVDILDVLIKLPNFSLGAVAPDSGFGVDGDHYLQVTSSLTAWVKSGATWIQNGTVAIGFVIPDTNFSVRTSLVDDVVTATAGFWFIDNDQYSIGTQAQFDISEADATLQTNDLVYASNDNLIHYINGTPGLGTPALPANSILIDTVIIPSVASGAVPYLVFGQNEAEAPTGVFVDLTTDQTIGGTKTFENKPNFNAGINLYDTINGVNVPIDASDGIVTVGANIYTNGRIIADDAIETLGEVISNTINPNSGTTVTVGSDLAIQGTIVAEGTATAAPATLSTELVTKGQLDDEITGTVDYINNGLDQKQNTVSLTTTGTSGAAIFNATTGALNIPQYVGLTLEFIESLPVIDEESDLTTIDDYEPYRTSSGFLKYKFPVITFLYVAAGYVSSGYVG